MAKRKDSGRVSKIGKRQGKLRGHVAQIEKNCKLNHQEQFEQLDFLKSSPVCVGVPTGERCNLRCICCCDRDAACGEFRDIRFDEFLKYTEPLQSASQVQLYGWGEPLINPAYEKIFDYVAARYRGTRICISTNGTLLTDKWVNKLLTYGKCQVNISLNASTSKTYARITKRRLFEHVVENVRRLVQAKEQKDANDLVITASFVAMKPNIHELPKFIELCAALGIRRAELLGLYMLRESHRTLFLGENTTRVRKIFLAARKIALDRGVGIDTLNQYPVRYFQQDRTAYSYSDLPKDMWGAWREDEALFYPQPGECYDPWQTFMARGDGSVYTCCRGGEVMGNLLEQDFEEIWNGVKYRAYRRSINSFRPPQACRECPVKMGYDLR